MECDCDERDIIIRRRGLYIVVVRDNVGRLETVSGRGHSVGREHMKGNGANSNM